MEFEFAARSKTVPKVLGRAWVGLLPTLWCFAAAAQTDTSTPASAGSRGGASDAVEVIQITGTKKARGQFAADAPVAVTAFGANQLDALQFRDIESLTFSIPNVSLDSVGTIDGVANFSIRGLGANSSIPTIDPTVGLFVNGVYFGSNGGAVVDSFDLEAVEVLRGPQGILFGRNVTGGAVLLRTKRPGDTYSAELRTSIETGLEYRLAAAVDAPVLPDLLKLRIAGQFRSDQGWFTNQAPVDVNPANPLDFRVEDQQFGADDTWLVRPTVTLTPTDNLTFHVMYEHGETDAEGPPAQSSVNAVNDARGNFQGPFDDFDFSIDEVGFTRIYWNQIFVEGIYDLGDAGQIVDIFGWRTLRVDGLSDIDSQPIALFHTRTGTDITHLSNELRYSGTWFDQFLDITAGLYFFTQRIEYRENRRLLFGMIDSTLGGNQDQISLGAFTQLEFRLTDEITAIAGARVTYETKDAEVATFNPAMSPCQAPPSSQCPGGFDFDDDQDWFDFSPKLGAKWAFAKNNQLYGHWTRGFRSGGYNLRNTSPDPAAAPGPFDEEQQDAFELGLKSGLFNGRVRFNVAGFFTIMQDLQREVNLPAEGAGVVQIIQNTADANIYGVELDASVVALDNLVFTGAFGYTDADYTDVRFDLNGDGQISQADEDLELPRLANITASFGAILDFDLGSFGLIVLRGNYAYRDESFFTDNNLGLLPSGHVVDASVAYSFPDVDLGGSYFLPKIVLYGRNLANEVFLGGQTPLPPALAPETPPLGGNFSPLKEGRVFGAELQLEWL